MAVAAQKISAVILALALALFLTVTGPAAQRPAAPPQRIISLVPAVTEMLFAIGAGTSVVGVSSFDRYPPEVASRARVGALVDPDFERILTLRPDLVVVYGSQDDLMRRLERAGIRYYVYRHAGLRDITATMRELGQLTGSRGEAERVAAGIERELAAVRASVAGQPRRLTALVFGRELGTLRGIYASGGIGFLHDMLELAGGTNVFADVKREGLQVSTEMLLARSPAVIIEIRQTPGWTPERLAAERALWSRLSAVPAVRTGRIHLLADDTLAVPGPRVAESVRKIATVLHAK